MKKIVIAAIALCGISTSTMAETNTYDLTVSTQGSSFLFEKSNNSNHTNNKYVIERHSTPKGTEYYFKISPNAPIENTDGIWQLITSEYSKTAQEAKDICARNRLSNSKWRSPTTAEVDGAMKNFDQSFGMAMTEMGKDTSFMGALVDGIYMYSNQSHKGKVVVSTSLTNPEPTLCIQE
ncbi:hypothetical protein [Aliivibrio fischeri]|uniref:hypothetical protein n=1 Tax=Aliivibrio fischeri TaxID=668 RepID=UPI00080E313E|nr:hypothetical protein [Aliivibrio fischeri]OCH48791.1 hypothetical protein A6E02_08105 [Aliivibrio fischeri]